MRKSQRLTPTTWNPGTAGLRKPESERKEGNAEEEKDKGISEGHVGKSGLKIGYMEYDKSQILISTKRCSKTSEEIYKLLLEKYHLQMEMRAGSYILAMTSIADTEEGFERLKRALIELDESCDHSFSEMNISFELPRAELVYPLGKAEEFRRKQQTESRLFEEAEGRISLEYAYLYPPGIPLLVPGERISGEVISQLLGYQKQGFSIEGIREQGRLEVISHG